jgi:hypothetical protein
VLNQEILTSNGSNPSLKRVTVKSVIEKRDSVIGDVAKMTYYRDDVRHPVWVKRGLASHQHMSGETLPYLLGLVLVFPQEIAWNLRLIFAFRFAHYVVSYGDVPALRTVCSLSAWAVSADIIRKIFVPEWSVLLIAIVFYVVAAFAASFHDRSYALIVAPPLHGAGEVDDDEKGKTEGQVN